VSFLTESSDLFKINLKPMFIWRPLKTGIKGFYVGLYPNIGFQHEKAWLFGSTNSLELGVGLDTGYKWVFKDGLTLQLGTGIGKTWALSGRNYYSGFDYLAYLADGTISLPNFDIHPLEIKLGYSW
jgi:hypothetical protein